MQSRAARLGVLAAVIVAAVVAFIVLRNNNSEESSSDASKGVEVLNVDASGNPVGGVKTLTYNKGDQVRLRVNLARPEEEVHVHGYEIARPAEHSPVTFSFPANLDGVFEIEVHRLDHTEGPIATLRVNP
jgi:FtsP/CotA-like multicopper oxidase with cupredoxin domain